MKKGRDMDKNREELIFERYLKGTASKEEQALVDGWYLEEADLAKDNPFDSSRYELMKDELWQNLPGNKENKGGSVYRNKWMAIAASLFIGLTCIGLYFYFSVPESALKNETSFAQVLPGTNKATLVLADGKRIELDKLADGAIKGQQGLEKQGNELVYQQGPHAGGTLVYHTLEIPYGGQYQMQLADGTKVWLNAGSSFTYPVSFNAGQRIVELNGEAYFEVAKDKERPFIVKNKTQTVQVLGTHFNIKAYGDEDMVQTSLLEGSVRVKSVAGNEMILKPGECSLVKGSGKIAVKPTDTAADMAWKNGKIVFKDASIQSLMKDVARWYNLEVVYKGEMPEELFTGGISRQSDLSKLLRILKLSGMQFYLDAKTSGKPVLVIEGKL